MIRSYATDKDDPTVEPRWGRVGKQKIEDTGPLTKKRMETCEDEFVGAAKDFIKRQNDAGKPFFVWLNTTHMHLFTHTKKESKGQAGRRQSNYHDTMIDHDKNVSEMLDLLDELGIAEDTVVIYAAQAAAMKFAETFKEFPPIQAPNTFTVDQAIAKMSEAASGAFH